MLETAPTEIAEATSQAGLVVANHVLNAHQPELNPSRQERQHREQSRNIKKK
jgi:hypothetical protein